MNRKYPWEKWFDGREHIILEEFDFRGGSREFRGAIWSQFKRGEYAGKLHVSQRRIQGYRRTIGVLVIKVEKETSC